MRRTLAILTVNGGASAIIVFALGWHWPLLLTVWLACVVWFFWPRKER